METAKNGPRFVESPRYVSRRRPFIDPGALALIGAIAAIVFIVVMLGLLEADLGFRLGDWFAR